MLDNCVVYKLAIGNSEQKIMYTYCVQTIRTNVHITTGNRNQYSTLHPTIWISCVDFCQTIVEIIMLF